MPEGPRDPESRATRGRRRPELLDQLAAQTEMEASEEELMASPGEIEAEELPALYPGDIVMARRSSDMHVADTDHWFSYGATSRIQPGESEEDAFYRIGWVVNTRVRELAAAAEVDIINDLQQRREEERRRPIRPQNRG